MPKKKKTLYLFVESLSLLNPNDIPVEGIDRDKRERFVLK